MTKPKYAGMVQGLYGHLTASRDFSVARDLTFEIELVTRIPGHDPPNLSKLYPYQVEGVHFLRERTKALLADEPGLGKTAQLLRALPSYARCICVVPASLRFLWRDEALIWRKDLRVTVAGPGELFLPEEGEILIVSYDSLPEPMPGNKKRLVNLNFRDVYLLFDEVHKIKSKVAERTKRASLLARQCHSTWGATGTPLVGTLDDFRGVLRAIGIPIPKGSLFTNEKDELKAVAAPHMLRRLKQNELKDLPDKRYKKFTCLPPEELLAQMNEAVKLLLEYDGRLPPFEMLSAIRAALATARIPELLELVTDYEEQRIPLVVFAAHVPPLLALENRPGWGTLVGHTPTKQRKALVDAFQNGELQGLACSIQVGGLGFTITRAAHAIFASMSYSPADNVQAEDRLVRIGQRANKVLFTHMIADHPLEHRLLEILARKDQLIEEMIGRTK